MIRNLLLALSVFFIISCETASHNNKPKIMPEPKKEVIYTPKEELLDNEVEEEDTPKVTYKDFSGIEDFQFKHLSSLKLKYGNFSFSKMEMNYEFHRYNADKCRVFIQNNTNDKKIIQITIFNLETNNTYKSYSRINCE
jgi:hypothetical protein